MQVVKINIPTKRKQNEDTRAKKKEITIFDFFKITNFLTI
jgi:hypothetical protein